MGTLCFWDRPQKDKMINGKLEAPQGLLSWAIVQFTSFGSSSNDAGIGLKSIGFGLGRFAGTAAGIAGLVSSGLGAGLDPKAAISGRILNGFLTSSHIRFC